MSVQLTTAPIDLSDDWYGKECTAPDQHYSQQASQHQAILTKPAGSLGRLEEIAEQFAAWQQTASPSLENVMIRVFAADHGVCAQNVSAFPQSVTAQMVSNFLSGGAAISVLNQHLSKQLKTNFSVVNMGLVTKVVTAADAHPQLKDFSIANGTADFTQQAAMSEPELNSALNAGHQQILVGLDEKIDLFIGGEMGIGNTTSASALYCALLDLPAATSVGPGTGVDQAGQNRKKAAIEAALQLHKEQLTGPKQILQHLGGFEIAALVGSYIAAAQNRIPVLVDGFITTAAALVAIRLNPSVEPWFLFAHRSAEPAHKLALQALQAKPILDLEMRLGEGSGAAVAVPILQSALELHNSMATFEEAAVSSNN